MRTLITDFSNIPKSERKQKWFLLLEPLVVARKSRPKWNISPLIQVLNRNWKRLKAFIEFFLKNVNDAESIFSRASQIKTNNDPDGIIQDMFAESRAAPYLLHKGFINIKYFRRENVDFIADFDNNNYYIEVAYIRGPSFKTQQAVFFSETIQQPIFYLDSQKLINRLKSICDTKEKQISKYGYTENNSIILLISDLEEFYEPYLEHDKAQNNHPVLQFVKTRKVPTVILHPGSVYEPESISLNENFGRLNKFDWNAFNHQY